LWGRQVQKESSRYNPFATRRHHLNPAKYLRPYAAGVASLWRLLSFGARGIFRRRDKATVVICPAMKLPAEVGLNPDLHMESCSRWPELQSCSQACMPQVQFSAEDLNEFAARYEDKKCGSCDAALTRDDCTRVGWRSLGPPRECREYPGLLAHGLSASRRLAIGSAHPATVRRRVSVRTPRQSRLVRTGYRRHGNGQTGEMGLHWMPHLKSGDGGRMPSGRDW